MKLAFHAYLLFSALLIVLLFLHFAWEDIDRLRKPHKYSGDKFGPNYKNPDIFFGMAFFLLPFVNIGTGIWYLLHVRAMKKDRIKMKAERELWEKKERDAQLMADKYESEGRKG